MGDMMIIFVSLCSFLLSASADTEAEVSVCGHGQTKCTLETCSMLLSEEFYIIKSQLKSNQDDIDALKREKEASKVFFSAALRKFGTLGPFSEETTVTYSHVFINKGNGYDNTTGVFTAPVSGVYLFLFYHHALGGESAYLSLTKNGERVVTTGHHKNTQEGSSNGANAVTIQLNKGDLMRIRLWAGSWVFDDDKNYTTFTGILLHTV